MTKKRKIEEAEQDHFIRPDVARESYGKHIRMRAEHFCFVLYKVMCLCVKYKPSKPYAAYLSDTADVQVGRGVYLTEKIDAAHLSNTSFMCDLFLSDIAGPISADLRRYCDDVRNHSGATTPQFKADNVGPDKVVDSFQTKFKNSQLGDVGKTQVVPSGARMYAEYVNGLNLALSSSSSRSFVNPGSGGYQGGVKARAVMVELDNGSVPWDVDAEFKHIANDVAKL